MRVSCLLALALTLGACPNIKAPDRPEISSFKVTVSGVYTGTGPTRVPLSVSTLCANRYGGQDKVPAVERGTPDCRYVVARGVVEIDFTARAIGRYGQALTTFLDPVSFKVLPGDLVGGYENRWKSAEGGVVEATIQSIHQYGQARVWAEHAPPKLSYDAGIIPPGARLPPEGTVYSYASGVSDIVWFEEQTLQSLNVPDGLDNRASPFVGEFVRIGTPPEAGAVITQTCIDDPARNGQPMAMVVTGIEPTGFYVTDISACRLKEVLSLGNLRVRTPEPPERCQVSLPDAGVANIEDVPGGRTGSCAISRTPCSTRGQCASYSPGTFGSMFVFNFSFPDGLNQGDLLFSLSGAVQEFTSTTQITFPAWTIADRVRLRPPDEWERWLKFAPPVEINYRLCGHDNVFSPFVTDALCGQSTSNLKLESLESALVKLRGISLPGRFETCDFDASNSVPFFCNRTDQDEFGNTLRSWGNCDFGTPPAPEPANDKRERECVQNCTLGRGPSGPSSCSERATFVGFGQYSVELAPPGPAWANLDDSSPNRVTSTPVTIAVDGGVALARPSRITGLLVGVEAGYEAGTYAVTVCDVPVRWRLGDNTVVAADTDPLLEARTVFKFRSAPGQDSISLRPTTASGRCYAAINPRTRINLQTKDAIPELNPGRGSVPSPRAPPTT